MRKIFKLGFPVEKKWAIAANIGQQQQNVDPKEFLSWGVQLSQSLLAIAKYYDKLLMISLLDMYFYLAVEEYYVLAKCSIYTIEYLNDCKDQYTGHL